MEILEDVGLVVAAGGSSRRFKAGNKLLAELGGTPLFVWCLRSLSSLLRPGAIAMAVPQAELPVFSEAAKWHLPEVEIRFASGGPTRTHSVMNALKALPEDLKIVAIHDAARPFVKAHVLAECVAACRKFGGAVAAKRVSDTIKEADAEGFAIRTLQRDALWAMETPQVFPRDTLSASCERAVAGGLRFTDDSAAVEHFFGVRPFLVENLSFNMKLTWPYDLEMAQCRLSTMEGQ